MREISLSISASSSAAAHAGAAADGDRRRRGVPSAASAASAHASASATARAAAAGAAATSARELRVAGDRRPQREPARVRAGERLRVRDRALGGDALEHDVASAAAASDESASAVIATHGRPPRARAISTTSRNSPDEDTASTASPGCQRKRSRDRDPARDRDDRRPAAALSSDASHSACAT